MADSSLEAIRYKRGSLALLDQRKLPLESIYIDILSCEAGWHAIKDMVVQGAPAIAIAAALSLAVELTNMKTEPRSAEAAVLFIQKQLDYLLSSRPTAVNLFEAASKLKNVAEKAAASGLSADKIFEACVEAAESMLVADVCSNKAIGMFGAKEVLNEVKLRKPDLKLRILTHCNTGSLATAAYGTALGIIRAIHSQGKIETVYCTETRPYNQGSRLTAYELVHEKIPAILIADSAAASLNSLGKVDAVIVGADRIACNGDTANKIGTYNLAVSAFYHNIPFYVAAPLTSIDISLPSGESIVIEERQPEELTHALGGHGPQIAANGVGVWNPAFDITPAKLITAIVTDKGVIRRGRESSFNISEFLMKTQNEASRGMIVEDATRAIENNGVAKQGKSVVDVDKGNGEFYILNENHVPEYINRYAHLVERLGGRSEEWTVKEVGDGNLNFVYIVVGPNGSLVLKQAIPYIRCVGESWPMTSDRSYYETRALKEHGSLCPDHVPEVYHFDRSMSAIAMRYIEPPHIILRKGLIAGTIYPLLAQHMSDYMAKTLFHTSLIANSTKTQKLAVSEFCSNLEMCRLTEQVIFTEPYMQSPNNHWTSPHLDGDAKDLCEDVNLKLEVAELKAKFCEKPQALLHGDLHTGSIMATVDSTQVIDPEFAFYGPIGFDVGAFLGNLSLSFFSQDGHANSQNDRQDYRDWILLTIVETWDLFEKKFTTLWDANWGCSGDAYPGEVYKTSEDRKAVMNKYLKEVFQDTLGFASAKMIRRIVGIAHVEDLESIENLDVRAQCERRALNFAKAVMKERHSIPCIARVIDMLRKFASST